MKFKVTIKSPDSFDYAMHDLIDGERQRLIDSGTDSDSVDEQMEIFENDAREFMSTWVSGGEYVTIEFNSDTKTCMVVPKLRK